MLFIIKNERQNISTKKKWNLINCVFYQNIKRRSSRKKKNVTKKEDKEKQTNKAKQEGIVIIKNFAIFFLLI